MPDDFDIPDIPEIPAPSDPLSANPPRPESARSDRPGIHVSPPAATDPDWHRIEHDAMQADVLIAQARYLFRVVRQPRCDPAWPPIRDGLLDLRNRLYGQRTDDAQFNNRLAEINQYLGPKYQ